MALGVAVTYLCAVMYEVVALCVCVTAQHTQEQVWIKKKL